VSPAGLFTLGVLVTLIVATAMAMLIYAAILDGRDAAARRQAGRESPSSDRAVSILATAQAAGSFETLVAAIDRAGLSDALEHDGPYTVFAPSDEAFAKLPAGAVQSLLATPEVLAEIVNYHLVPGRMTAADIVGRISAETLQGEDRPSPTTARSVSTAPASSPATSKRQTESFMSSTACCCRHASERSNRR
jgi:uncharacterized surface protein with fasciclin (FAS1) repeats